MADDVGWIYDPVPKHYCILPTNAQLESHFEGAIWKCGTCDMHWEVFYDTAERRKELRGISPHFAEERIRQAVSAHG